MNSKPWSLNGNDFLKGLVVTVLTAIITGVYQLIQNNQNFMTWISFKPILIASLGAGLAYMLKNFSQNSQGEMFKKDSSTIDSLNVNRTNNAGTGN
jgi:hypothetical protein